MGFVFAGMYDVTPWPLREGATYAGCCSLGVRIPAGGGCWGVAEEGVV